MAKTEIRDITAILNNKKDRQTLLNFVQEGVQVKQKQKDLNEDMKVLKEDAREKLGLDPKIFNDLVRLQFKATASEELDRLEQLETAIQALFNLTEPTDEE